MLKCPLLNECLCDDGVITDVLLPPQCRRKVFKLRCQDFKGCAYCGNEEAPLTLDHFIPKSRGGYECARNYIPACGTCNAKKGNTMPQVWYPKQAFFCLTRWLRIIEVLQVCPVLMGDAHLPG